MKKIFAFAAAAIFALSMNAKQVVFDFTKPASLGANPAITPSADKSTGVDISGSTFTVDGVVMSSAKVQKNDNKIFTKSDGVSYELRTYNTNTITFTAEDNITAIEFAGDAVAFDGLTGKTWVGEAKSVTLTGNGTSKITSATLTVGEAAVVWTPDTIEVAEAIALAKAADKHDHFVKGVVHGEPFCTYAFKDKVSFWMHDIANAADTLEFYDGMGKDNQKWESLDAAKEELRIGDTILVYAASLQPYHPKEAADGVYIYEIAGGHYVEKLGANPNPPVIIGPDTLSVSEAVVEALKLGNNEVSTKDYVVRGYVAKIKTPFNADYNNISLFMTGDPNSTYGELQAYRIGMAREDSAKVVDHAYIQIKGKLKNNFYNDKNSAYIQEGNLTVVEAPAIQEIDVTTAMELGNALEDNAKTPDVYKVVGYVAKVKDAWEEEEGIETFFMSDDPEATFGDFQARLVTIADPGAKVGDRVAVTGQITKYVGASGNPTIQIDRGTAEVVHAQGIENITLTEKAQKVVVDGVIYIVRDNKMFNLQGAQVR